MFVIKNKIIGNNINYTNKIENYRVSNFNFMPQKQIIKMLKNLGLLS